VVIATDERNITIYVHRGANPDGTNEYVELAEFDGRIAEPWYETLAHERCGLELNMDLELAERVSTAISAVRAGRRPSQ